MKKILVVDDDEMIREVLKRKLENDQTNVVTAKDGLEALQIVAQESPDLILMDICMPGMNGYDACKVLRENRRTRNIPLIMITSLGEIADHLHGLKCGADEYMVKPVDLGWLAAKVRTLLLRHVPAEIRLDLLTAGR